MSHVIVFYLVGPMTNAAGAQRVVIGVFEENLVELMAQTLVEVRQGVDEVTLILAPSHHTVYTADYEPY